MIKISANISKKVPIPSAEYSSQQFGAALEIEISDSERSDAIQARIRELYHLLSSAVDEQIAAGTVVQPAAAAQSLPAPRSTVTRWNQNPQPEAPAKQLTNGSKNISNGNAAEYVNGNGIKPTSKRATASEAQCRAIFAICKNLHINIQDVLADYNVADASELPIKDASRLIDELKNRQAQPQR